MYAIREKDADKYRVQRDARLMPGSIKAGDKVVLRVCTQRSGLYAYREYSGSLRDSPTERYHFVLDTVNENGKEHAIPLVFDENGMLISSTGKPYGYVLKARLYARVDKHITKAHPRGAGYVSPLVPSGGTF